MEERELSAQIAVMYELYKNYADKHGLRAEEQPVYLNGSDEDDGALPVGYTLVFNDGTLMLGKDMFVSVPPSKYLVKGDIPGKPHAVYPHPSGMEILQSVQ